MSCKGDDRSCGFGFVYYEARMNQIPYIFSASGTRKYKERGVGTYIQRKVS